MQTFDAIILAKGAPNRTSTGKVTMCAIALSQDFGLVRLYPLTFEQSAGVGVWSRIEVTATRSTKDNRHESWKIESSKLIGKVDQSHEKTELLNQCILKSGTEDPIAYQNKHRSSIAIVKTSLPVGCGLRPRKDREPEDDSEERWRVMTQDEYPFKPYLLWTSDQGGEHETHIVAQEAYVGMSKNASCQMRIFENMRLGDPDYQHWIVLGNMKDRRNVWVCPHLHRLKKTYSDTTLSLPMSDGRGDAWPYLTQEAINAKDAGPQRFFTFITDTT